MRMPLVGTRAPALHSPLLGGTERACLRSNNSYDVLRTVVDKGLWSIKIRFQQVRSCTEYPFQYGEIASCSFARVSVPNSSRTEYSVVLRRKRNGSKNLPSLKDVSVE